ncbi:MAG: hypothetical protein IKA61_02805 [Clostridia bacterium]|nr:hypothetical protein [Clostridia bacterium]
MKYKKTLDMVCERANLCCERGDYLSALSSLLNEMELRPDCADVCAHLADIYTELGIYENAISMWFRFLLRAKEGLYWEGYNGLGASFYFLGNKYMAGYYFNEQLMKNEEIDGVYADVLEEFIEGLDNNGESGFSIVKEKTSEDVGEEIIQGALLYADEQNCEKALELLSSIEDSNPKFGEASFEKACLYLNSGDFERAYACVQTSLKSGFAQLSAISLAIDLASATGDSQADEYKEMLLKYQPIDDEDKYKKLIALCDYSLFDEALSVANQLLNDNVNDANTSYIKGFLLYNKGDFEGAERCFKNAYLLSYSYPSLYYLKVAQRAVDGKPLYKELEFKFSVPDKVNEENTDILKGFISGDKTLAEFSDSQLLELADWCFSTKDENLQFSLGWVYVRSGDEVLTRKIKEELVNPSVSDSVKQSLVSIMCDLTKDLSVKVVYENFFINLKFNRPELKDENKELFKKAYAKAFGRLSVLNLEKMYRLSIGASELQKELISAGKIDCVKSISALSCAMYFYSGLNVFQSNESAYEVFGAKKEDVISIIKLTEIKDEN